MYFSFSAPVTLARVPPPFIAVIPLSTEPRSFHVTSPRLILYTAFSHSSIAARSIPWNPISMTWSRRSDIALAQHKQSEMSSLNALINKLKAMSCKWIGSLTWYDIRVSVGSSLAPWSITLRILLRKVTARQAKDEFLSDLEIDFVMFSTQTV